MIHQKDCLCELEKCLVHLEGDYRHKLEVEPHNEKLKKSLHNVREDLKKIGTLPYNILTQKLPK
jgi:hypothetical protein